MLPAEIKGIADFLAETRAKPETIILSHSHWDHILGPERFPGVRTMAQSNYLSETEGHNGARIRQQIADWESENGIERPPERPFSIPAPDRIFAESTSVTVGDDLSLRLNHAPGHAADQLVVYQAESGTLWASDILSDLEIPFISHNLQAYERTLAMLSRWELRVLVPGHGHATEDPDEIRQRISEDMAYLVEIRQLVEKSVRQGKTVEETVALGAGMRFRLPEDNHVPHRLNIESVYIELGGEADATRVGWGQANQ
jgi:glyoxylase-like metal-dependent hydrolase (beta-lactamase superfamily II)